MWPTLAMIMRIAVIAYAGIVGLAAALVSFGIITPLPKAEAAVWIISLVVIGAENIGTLIVRRFHRKRGNRKAKVEDALASALIQIVRENPTLHLEELGANVYMFSKWDRFRRVAHDETRLNRVARLRPGRYPQQSGVAWAAGKGAVGVCWTMKKRIHRDWHALAAKYGSAELDQTTFEAISEATRCGFTQTEFQAIVGKYSEVLAEPIWDSRKTGVLMGVITIDRAYRATSDVFMAQLDKRATHASAGIAAGVVSRILKPRAVEE